MAEVSTKKPEEVGEMKQSTKQEQKMEYYESFSDMVMDLWMNSLNAKYASSKTSVFFFISGNLFSFEAHFGDM